MIYFIIWLGVLDPFWLNMIYFIIVWLNVVDPCWINMIYFTIVWISVLDATIPILYVIVLLCYRSVGYDGVWQKAALMKATLMVSDRKLY